MGFAHARAGARGDRRERKRTAGAGDRPGRFRRFSSTAANGSCGTASTIPDPPEGTLEYYHAALAASAKKMGVSEAALEADVRVFLAPGVYHCGGGPGPDSSTCSRHSTTGSRAANRRCASSPQSRFAALAPALRLPGAGALHRFGRYEPRRELRLQVSKRTNTAFRDRLGVVVRFTQGTYELGLRDDNGYVDNVRLHDGRSFPIGLTLRPGMRVRIVGFDQGSAFTANEIDVPRADRAQSMRGANGYARWDGELQCSGCELRERAGAGF